MLYSIIECQVSKTKETSEYMNNVPKFPKEGYILEYVFLCLISDILFDL